MKYAVPGWWRVKGGLSPGAPLISKTLGLLSHLFLMGSVFYGSTACTQHTFAGGVGAWMEAAMPFPSLGKSFRVGKLLQAQVSDRTPWPENRGQGFHSSHLPCLHCHVGGSTGLILWVGPAHFRARGKWCFRALDLEPTESALALHSKCTTASKWGQYLHIYLTTELPHCFVWDYPSLFFHVSATISGHAAVNEDLCSNKSEEGSDFQ